MSTKLKITALSVLWLVLGLVTSPLQAEDSLPPDQLVKQTSDRVLKALETEKTKIDNEPNYVYRLIDEIVLPHMDFEGMAKLAMGRHWRDADDQQRAQFTQEFRTLLVRTYSKSLTEFTGLKINYLPFRSRPGDKQATVRSEVEQSGSFPIPIEYTLHLKDGGWKVFDISIDGISLVTNYRSSFAREVREKGIDGLIKVLADRNAQGLS